MPDPKLLFCIAALAIALTAALVWTAAQQGEFAVSATPSVALALDEPETSEAPMSPLDGIDGTSAEEELYHKIVDALDDAFDAMSPRRIYDVVSGKTVDLSWEKALRALR